MTSAAVHTHTLVLLPGMGGSAKYRFLPSGQTRKPDPGPEIILCPRNVTPRCLSWAIRTTLSRSTLDTTMRDPPTTNPPTTANSVKTGSNCGPRAFFSGGVKYPLAIALLSSFSAGS